MPDIQHLVEGRSRTPRIPSSETNTINNGQQSPGGSPGGSNESPLREWNADEIYSVVSDKSNSEQKNPSKEKQPRNRRRKSKDGSSLGSNQESPTIIGNALSFFNRRADKKESRYSNEEEEEEANAPYTPTHEENDDEGEQEEEVDDEGVELTEDPYFEPNEKIEGNGAGGNNGYVPTTKSSFFPSRFGSRKGEPSTLPDPNGTEENTQHKLKNKLRLFRGRKKDKNRKQSVVADIFQGDEDVDAATGERARILIGRLSLSASAIHLVGSCLLEDENGTARAPLLMSLLGFRITDVSPSVHTKLRRFRIDLEYGVGPQRLQWSVEKNAKDLLYLHSRFKFEKWKTEVVRSNKTDLPRYPLPPLRNTQDHSKKRNDEYQMKNNTIDGLYEGRSSNRADDDASFHSAHTNHTFRDQFAQLRAALTNVSSIEDQSPEQLRIRIQKNQEYIKEVTNYLDNLISLVGLKPQSNRLFQFFEISPISSLLSYETGYKGKQGIVHVGGTAKSQGWRVGHFKANDLKGMIDRRSEKWLLVRNSYVMYVSNINSTLPLDVFLVDSKFRVIFKRELDDVREEDDSDYDDSSLIQKKLAEETVESDYSHKNVFQHLKITLENAERKLTIIPKSAKEQKLWISSLMEMKNSTIYSEPNRFGSFAPVRQNCFAQWFVDGRDYFWAVSSALEMAKDVIFIHDWWLSPELYLRRPANGNQQFRIDRILQRKAKQGVKIFVIVYRNVGTTVATDSLYTKHSILSLDEENIHVIRSPNQLLQNTYFWAHHEKLCIIDHTVSFLGGIDLCYGRFDTPDHVLTDDSDLNFASLDPEKRHSPEDFIKFQIFPGKDYSNPRVKDFFALDKPYESMYDRSITPRMPWHDVHMVTSGKVARDLSRHFVQRWNYLIRQKRPSRFTPLLTPPSDLTDIEVENMGLNGTCEVQLLRSSGSWSLGLKEHEQSIQNAYLKLIETSDHFVYIENQFFVTSCFIDGNEIKNRIGDALVDRIIRAYNEGTNWKAIIVIPLMPGFESQVDEPDGSSVRVIMQCQYMSISRGTTSIFAKLRKYGIDPDDYIQFYSLRKWGRIGTERTLVTEQLYIHAKTMVVDDRVAIIGSANINERSMRGLRDSEVAAIVRDKATIESTIDGEPYLVGKFAHTLRMRLMREHLGVNVDILEIVERRFRHFEEFARTEKGLEAATNTFKNKKNAVISAMVEIASRDILDCKDGTFRWKSFQESTGRKNIAPELNIEDETIHGMRKTPPPLKLPISFNNRTGTHEANRGIRDKKKHSYDARVQRNEEHKKDVYGDGLDKYKTKLARRARLNNTRFLKELAHKSMSENPSSSFLPDLESVIDFLESDDIDMIDEMDEQSEAMITERNEERWKLLKKISYLQRVAAKEREEQDQESKKRVAAGMEPDLNYKVPEKEKKSTPEPDNVTVDVGKAAPEANLSMGEGSSENSREDASDHQHIPVVTLGEEETKAIVNTLNPVGIPSFTKFVDPYCFSDPLHPDFYDDLWSEHARRNTEIFRLVFHSQPDNEVETWKEYKLFSKLNRAFILSQQQEAKLNKKRARSGSISDDSDSESEEEPLAVEADKTAHNANKRQSQASVYVKDSPDVGLLGHAPPTADSSDSKKSSRYDNFKSIPENYREGSDDKAETFDEGTKDGGDLEATDANGADIHGNTNGTSYSHSTGGGITNGTRNRRRKRTTFARRRLHSGEKIFERDSAERILNQIQGHLVMFPTEWLLRELEGENWFYNTDRIPPIDIYD